MKGRVSLPLACRFTEMALMWQMRSAPLSSDHSALAMGYAARFVHYAVKLRDAYNRHKWARARVLELIVAMIKSMYITLLSCGNLKHDVSYGTVMELCWIAKRGHAFGVHVVRSCIATLIMNFIVCA